MLWVVPAHPAAVGATETPREQTQLFPTSWRLAGVTKPGGLTPPALAQRLGWLPGAARGLKPLWRALLSAAAASDSNAQLSPGSFTVTNSMVPKAVIAFSCWPDLT